MFQSKPIEASLIDEAEEIYLHDSDVIDALSMHARGFYSDQELLDRLKLQWTHAQESAQESLNEKREDDAFEARIRSLGR